MQCIHMHTCVYIHSHTACCFLPCNKDIYFLCAPGRSNPSERSWCCYRLNTIYFYWCQDSRELFMNCLSFAGLSAGYLPWKLCCSNYHQVIYTQLLVMNWWALRDYQGVYKSTRTSVDLGKSFMSSKPSSLLIKPFHPEEIIQSFCAAKGVQSVLLVVWAAGCSCLSLQNPIMRPKE